MLANKFYVDNLIVTKGNKTELLEAGQQLASSMAEVGLPLREWNSNSPEVLEALSDESFGAESKVLGYAFSLSEDVMPLR